MENKKKRLYYLDAVGGLLLIHMIVGHCCQWSQTEQAYQSWTFWLDFFMPWFFFKAGMFFKCRPLKDEVKKSFRRLIIPFIYFTIVGMVIYWMKLAVNGELSLKSFITPAKSIFLTGATAGNMALWFLLSLFIVRIILVFIHNRISSADSMAVRYIWITVTWILCLIFIPVYYLLELRDINYPLWMSNIPSGMLFFVLGYVFRNFRPGKAFIMILLVGYVVIMAVYPTVVDMREGKLISGEFLLWIPTALMGILTFNSVFRLMFRERNPLSAIGAETMPYYCMHWCVIVAVSIFFVTETGVPDIPFLIALLTANIIILPIATYLIKKSRFAYIIG